MNINEISKKIDQALLPSALMVEVRLQKLMRDCPAKIKKRAQDYSVSFRVRLIKKSKDKYYFFVKKPGTKQYRVNFEFKGNDPDKLKDDVRVSCTCGFFKFYGCDFNATENDYNLRKMSNGSPPDIRDPERENNICKHVYAASKVLVDNLESMHRD